MPYTLAHTMHHEDPQILISEVEKFKEGKKEIRIRFSTTAVVAALKPVSGILMNGQQGAKPVFAIITSCFITWIGDKEEFDKWEIERLELFKQSMK